jgi:pimeloyl-ACP methyl ester carboxylesterase
MIRSCADSIRFVPRDHLKISRWTLLLGLAAFMIAAVPGFARAVDKDPNVKEIPKPLDIELETRDGLQLQATYYGSIMGKEAVPIIMLHAFKRSRADFEGLALAMQARGHAVIVPDLRGHGKSTQITVNGETRSIDQATMRRADFDAMVTKDLETVKQFLMEKNNAGELNIEKLCVVGNEMGAVLAADWAILDWHWPQLPAVKQGKDVKALVLLSPPMNFHGISMTDAMNRPLLQTQLSIMIMYGDKNKQGTDDAKRIFTRLNSFRPKLTEEERADRQDLFLVPLHGVALQGADILNDKSILAQLDAAIGQFIELRLVKKKFPWTNRPPALQ